MFSSHLSNKAGSYSVAVHYSSSPYLNVYNVNPANIGTATTFTKIADAVGLPTSGVGYGNGVNWSPDGTFLAYCATVNPFIAFYTRDGDKLTKVATVTTNTSITNSVRGGSWHPSGNLFTTGGATTPFISNFARDGQTFSIMSTASSVINSLPAVQTWAVSWNPQGNIVTLTNNGVPRITSYWYDGTKFTKLAQPTTTPTGSPQSVNWNRDGTVVALGHATAPFITAYWVNYAGTATTFTKLANPAVNPGSEVYASTFNNTGSSLICITASSPFICAYNISYNGTSTTLTKLAAMPSNGTFGFGLRCLQDDSVFAMRYTTPWINYYTRSGDTFTLSGTRPASLPTNNTPGHISIWPASPGLF